MVPSSSDSAFPSSLLVSCNQATHSRTSLAKVIGELLVCDILTQASHIEQIAKAVDHNGLRTEMASLKRFPQISLSERHIR
jgi:hypothetical protein